MAHAAEGPAVTDPAKADADFAIQGEYAGQLRTGEGSGGKFGLQVIAKGEGKFEAVLYKGGLPGDGAKRGDEVIKMTGKTEDGATTLTGTVEPEKKIPAGNYTATLKKGDFAFKGPVADRIGRVKKVERKSPTLGAKAPEGAVILFDGTNADAWNKGKVVDEDLLNIGVMSKQDFKDFTLHMEFKTPYMPAASGQGRGNSGLYLQNRYELQILDSFGLNGENNECGGFYQIAKPDVNMCFPPLAWQTYDIDFTGARFDDKGNKTAKAKAKIKHNGVVIHDIELPNITPGGASTEAPGQGPFALQDHGNPVRFRNIWVVEKK
ncbi:MAG: DUF1080 domain-containing protein [Planctomycetota bacterium]|nr:DUF1080 domain-containing protein [Planctomycetota bacterium]